MHRRSTILYDYENVLLEKQGSFNVCFKSGTQESIREISIIWRYALEEILGWNAYEAEKNLSFNVIYMLCLEKTYCGLYEQKKPSGFIGDYKRILQYVYPGIIRYNEETEAIKEYLRVSSLDEWKNEDRKYRYPKRFFKENTGIKRAQYLLNYVVSRYLGDMSSHEQYLFFAERNPATKWIRGKNLKLPLDMIFSSPLDYYHSSLPDHKKDDYDFYVYKIRNKCYEIINNTESDGFIDAKDISGDDPEDE